MSAFSENVRRNSGTLFEMEPLQRRFSFKVMVIGDSGVGKTSLMRRYCKGVYTHKYKMTIGADFMTKEIRWDTNTKVSLQIWDTAGQERFGNVNSVYFRGAHGALVVYDVKRNDTKFNTLKWKEQVYRDTRDNSGHYYEPPCLLIANKSDLLGLGDDCLSMTDMNNFAEKGGFIDWKDTSCLRDEGVDESMKTLIASMIKRDALQDYSDDDIISLGADIDRSYDESSWASWCGGVVSRPFRSSTVKLDEVTY